MKIYTLINLVCTSIAFMFYYGAAQNFEEPKRYYKPMQFDDQLRGSFNTTPCLREMLHCWEMITPEMICHQYTYYSTACELRFAFCNDHKGWNYSGIAEEAKDPYDFHAFDMGKGVKGCPLSADDYFDDYFGYEYYKFKQLNRIDWYYNYSYMNIRRAGKRTGMRVGKHAGKRVGNLAANDIAAPNDTVMFWL